MVNFQITLKVGVFHQVKITPKLFFKDLNHFFLSIMKGNASIFFNRYKAFYRTLRN